MSAEKVIEIPTKDGGVTRIESVMKVGYTEGVVYFKNKDDVETAFKLDDICNVREVKE